MSRDGVVLLALIVLSASWALAHLLLLLRVLLARSLPRWQRAIALVPIATPWLALRAGMRLLPGLWALFGAAYLATRAFLP